MQRKNNHTSSLFHYTNNDTSLLSIIKEGFKFSYCKEELSTNRCIGIPMISFCDIPIGNSAEHESKYGSYAIGISKSSLIKAFPKGIGPVNYFIDEQTINAAFNLKIVADEYKNSLKTQLENETNNLNINIKGNTYTGRFFNKLKTPKALESFYKGDDYHKAATTAIGFMKRYDCVRKGIYQVNYDESEWRMVFPENAKIEDGKLCKWFWNEKEYDEWRNTVADKFIPNWTLTFEVEDISFIIVPYQKDIPIIISKLSEINNICGMPLTEENRFILYSKVISFEQIKNDF